MAAKIVNSFDCSQVEIFLKTVNFSTTFGKAAENLQNVNCKLTVPGKGNQQQQKAIQNNSNGF